MHAGAVVVTADGIYESCLWNFRFLQVVPGIERLTKTGVLFTNGATEIFDTIIMATGYFSNVPNWLKVRNKKKNNNKQKQKTTSKVTV
jgi:hypothetical protein